MINKYIVKNKTLLLSLLLLISCGPKVSEWNDPKKIYDLLCSCQNQKGLTIDEQLKVVLKQKGVPAGSTDEINTYIGNNTEGFIDIIDQHFMADTIYLQRLIIAKDTLNAHGSSMDVKGGIGTLFSIKAKYPACIAALPYITL